MATSGPPVRVRLMALTMAATLRLASAQDAGSLFPLSVGNSWHYECQYVNPGYEGGQQHVCRKLDASDSVEATISVIGEYRVADSAVGRFEEIPLADETDDGQTYYLLSGSLVRALLFGYESPCGELLGLSAPNAVLARVGEAGDVSVWESGEESDTQNIDGIWLRGAKIADEWTLFDGDYLLCDLSPDKKLPDYRTYAASEQCYLHEVRRIPGDFGETGSHVGGLPVGHAVLLGSPLFLHTPYVLKFSRGVGLLQLSEFELHEAYIDGRSVSLPTALLERTWGATKQAD